MLQLKHLIWPLLFLATAFPAISQNNFEIKIYTDSQAVSMGLAEEDIPVLYAYLLDKKADGRAAVLIFPGGGYTILSMEKEGSEVAKWYNERGANAFVLKYRLGKFDGSGFKHPDMMQDGKRAMRIIRSNAAKWGIEPNKIGVMGFSAGGHMASVISTHFDDGNPEAADAVERESCLPNFSVLAYPVISMNDKYAHWGSRRFLLGPTPRQEDMDFLSTHQHIRSQTPPTFLFHTSDDKSVAVQNSVNYYLALREAGIPAEMHIFEHGPHGVGLAPNNETLSQWTVLLEKWLMNWKVFPVKAK